MSIIQLSDEICGESVQNKLQKISNIINKNNAKAIFISDYASCSWVLNIRQNKKYTGICNIHLLILNNEKYYIIKNIKDFIKYLIQNKDYIDNIIIDKKEIKKQYYKKLQQYFKNDNIIDIQNNVLEMKAIKNQQEINGMISAYCYDMKVYEEFIKWFECSLNNKIEICEMDCVKKIRQIRKKNVNFITESFPSIIAFNASAATIHYQTSKKNNKIINPNGKICNGLLLTDIGAHYKYGTTDFTRTILIENGKINFSSLNKEMQIIDKNSNATIDNTNILMNDIKYNFNLVLQGYNTLVNTKFNDKITVKELDSIARQFLLKENKNYKHATSHGVGFYLYVHEYPLISPKSENILTPEMIISIEPGYYLENQYGIRIEDLFLIKKSNDNKNLYFFTNLSLS